MNSASKIIVVLLFALCVVDSARILGVFYIPSRSHHILGEALFKNLAKKGHQVTMLSPYSIGQPMENYRELVLHDMLKYKEEYMQDMIRPDDSSKMDRMVGIIQQIGNITEVFWASKPVQDLLKSDEQFDLVLSITAMNPCVLALGDRFKAPTVLLSTVGSNLFTNEVTGNPTPFSYVSVFINSFDETKFLDRLVNSMIGVVWQLFTRYLLYMDNQVLRRHLPSSPPLEELMHKVDLVLLNSHYSVESVRPYLPNMVQIGGFHIGEPKPLPKDIGAFLDAARDGAVFFSLGSNVKLSKLPGGQKDVIVRTLGKLKERVLLKSDEKIEALPKNMMVGKWFPQTDILAHPNIKAFVSHGGLLSTLEAVHHGVPIVGLPCFADQESNMMITERAGYAIKLDIMSMDENAFYKAIRDIIDDKKYKENIQKRSALFRERPMKPMDTAIYWIEHVLKHGGASHLRSPRLNLYWYQYLLLDVAACIAAVLIIVMLVAYLIIKTIIRCCRRNKIKNKDIGKKKRN